MKKPLMVYFVGTPPRGDISEQIGDTGIRLLADFFLLLADWDAKTPGKDCLNDSSRKTASSELRPDVAPNSD
jgi:hypothetical protein